MIKFLRDIVVTLLIALTIFVVLQATVQNFKVEGMSMSPTIHNGEYLIVNKATYSFNSPQRGEIIVFRAPHNPNSDYVKRIIALPGDTIEIIGGTIFVNDIPLVEPSYIEPPRYIVPSKEIPPDSYFVLGDNRNNSQDSHNGWNVPRDYIIGKAWFTIWPPAQWGSTAHYHTSASNYMNMVSKPNLASEILCQVK